MLFAKIKHKFNLQDVVLSIFSSPSIFKSFVRYLFNSLAFTRFFRFFKRFKFSYLQFFAKNFELKIRTCMYKVTN